MFTMYIANYFCFAFIDMEQHLFLSFRKHIILMTFIVYEEVTYNTACCVFLLTAELWVISMSFVKLHTKCVFLCYICLCWIFVVDYEVITCQYSSHFSEM